MLKNFPGIFSKTPAFAGVASLALGFFFAQAGATFGAETVRQLVFSDEFDGSALDDSKWTRVDAGAPEWRKYMDATSSDLVEFKDGCLVLKGKKDTADASVRDYREAGIFSPGKFSFRYGKVEIRAKFDSIQGVWPALWMMPVNGTTWPSAGEIDIMEHLNYEGSVYQTLHFCDVAGGSASASTHPNIDKTVFNTYGIEWEEDKISFLINDVVTATFTPENTSAAWPFNEREFYFILSMQIGGSWVENTGQNRGIDAATIYASGANMYVDYVRVWQDVAPEIPEPSMFGVLAGLGALALAGSRRRRKSGK